MRCVYYKYICVFFVVQDIYTYQMNTCKLHSHILYYKIYGSLDNDLTLHTHTCFLEERQTDSPEKKMVEFISEEKSRNCIRGTMDLRRGIHLIELH